MAYFKDLTRYTYGDGHDARTDVNVGWLEAGHKFPKAIPDPAFVDALVRCCLHPVRLYRGFHVCDLCAPAEQTEPPYIEHKGRKIRLGNGEVRVEGPDRRWFTASASRGYAAPTLVAHYVTEHHYSPPAPFVEGVLKAAAQVWCLDDQFGRLRSLSATERFHRCFGLLEDLNSRKENPWVGAALERIAAAREVYLSPAEDGYTMQLLMHRLFNVIPRDEATEPEKWFLDAVLDLTGVLQSAGPKGSEDLNLETSARLIERLVVSGKVESPW